MHLDSNLTTALCKSFTYLLTYLLCDGGLCRTDSRRSELGEHVRTTFLSAKFREGVTVLKVGNKVCCLRLQKSILTPTFFGHREYNLLITC